MICELCGGDGKAHGSDRPFVWNGDWSYPGPCPVCNGYGVVYCCEGVQPDTSGDRKYPPLEVVE